MTFAEVLPKILSGGKYYRESWKQEMPAQPGKPKPEKILRFYVTSYEIAKGHTVLIAVSEATGQVTSYNPRPGNMQDKAGDITANDWNQLK